MSRAEHRCTLNLEVDRPQWPPSSGHVFTKSKGKPHKGGNQSFGLNKMLKAAGTTKTEGKLRYGFRHGFCVALANDYFGDQWTRPKAREMLRQDDEKVADYSDFECEDTDNPDDDTGGSSAENGGRGLMPLTDVAAEFLDSGRANPIADAP